MNLVPRQDRVLLVGLAATLLVVFARPIRYVLDLAYQVEQSSGLALIPGLIILTAVFLFHQQAKRQETKAHVAAAEADAQEAATRVGEMERLVTFGEALGRSLDFDAIRDVVANNLPMLSDNAGVWVMTLFDNQWELLTAVARESRREVEQRRMEIAERALARNAATRTVEPVITDDHLVVPMSAGGQTVGVVGVPLTGGPQTDGRRRILSAAAALLGISLRNADLFRSAREHSVRDDLTGCYTRSHAIEVLDSELRRSRRSHSTMSLIMFDIDHFKEINDRHGHLAGDAVLAAVGARMRDVLRGSDLKCRYGGEEFLVLLPETPLEGAKRVADTIRRELAEMQVTWKDRIITITASFGVTTALPAEIDTQAIIARADAALYDAKEQGRNCVRLGSETAVA
jgi:diguanylate cyclase (GGDEF)-like protein